MVKASADYEAEHIRTLYKLASTAAARKVYESWKAYAALETVCDVMSSLPRIAEVEAAQKDLELGETHEFKLVRTAVAVMITAQTMMKPLGDKGTRMAVCKTAFARLQASKLLEVLPAGLKQQLTTAAGVAAGDAAPAAAKAAPAADA